MYECNKLWVLFSEMLHKAAFGAGCFWGTEKFFRKQFRNSLTTIGVGYMGGATLNPRYEVVCSGSTGHAEVVYMEFNSTDSKITYEQLVDFFYRMHDPTTKDRQGDDKGSQYRSVIFYYDDNQLVVAKKVTQRLGGKVSGQIVTTFEPAAKYYPAEKYHQNYLGKPGGGYCNHYLRW